MSFIGVIGILIVCTAVQAQVIIPRCLFPCTADYRPVCGNDIETYPNECAMRTAACKQKKAIVAIYAGECKPRPSHCAFPCKAIYMPVCGSDGNKYASECMMRGKACNSEKAITVVSRFAFEHTDCASEEACNIPCTRDFKPVCGSDGRTHSNECTMTATSCAARTAIIRVYDGPCQGEEVVTASK